MSQWTHVCGCIRVDALRILERDEKADIRNALGQVVEYGDNYEEATIPCGSEGSIKYEIIENPDKSCIAAFTVPIWGDLRDYDSEYEIIEWFKKACDKLFIRNAVISIEVEGRDEVSYIYKRERDDT